MQDDLNIPKNDNNAENPTPKKRGRPARVATKKATTKRTRSSRAAKPVEETPDFRDAPQSYDLDFKDYSDSKEDSSEERQEEESNAYMYASIEPDEALPMSFSTSDEDLVHDSYRRDFSDEGDEDFIVIKSETADIAASMEEQIEDDSQSQNEKRNNNRKQNNRQQNNRNNRNQNNRQQNNRNNNNNQQNNRNDNRGENNKNKQNNRNNNQQNNRNNKQGQNKNQQNNRQQNNQNQTKIAPKPSWQNSNKKDETSLDIGELQTWQTLKKLEETKAYLADNFDRENIVEFADYYTLNTKELVEKLEGQDLPFKPKGLSKYTILAKFIAHLGEQRTLLRIEGVLDLFEKSYGGVLCFARDNFELKRFCPWLSPAMIEAYGLKRGHSVSVLCCPPRIGEEFTEKCPIALEVESVMGKPFELVKEARSFNDLIAYYPTERMILEMTPPRDWDNLSMRTVDLLTPIGLGQRALIVAPPRTGKTVLMQAMAKSIRANTPQANVIILLVDERPEEVTDFKENVDAMVIASTFDQDAHSHVHAAEMVISLARRMVEQGEDVVILLDSITRMARAYNATMPSSGKIMSGGVESNALQKPKRFFGSARNVEGGGSLTIIGTALVETGSKMDDVIFEEFKGTGNMEINLDRSLVDKRIFPAINIEKSATRKEELLYHPDEMQKIYALRRVMKNTSNTEAMEMLVQRLRKTRTNIEFLMGLNR